MEQEQFWGMNSFFRQARATAYPHGRDLEYATLEDKDFKGRDRSSQVRSLLRLRNGHCRWRIRNLRRHEDRTRAVMSAVESPQELASWVTIGVSGQSGRGIGCGHISWFMICEPIDDLVRTMCRASGVLERLGSIRRQGQRPAAV